MKRSNLFVLTLLSLAGSASAQWNSTETTWIPDNRNAILGVSNARSVNLRTNDTTRVVVDSLGNVVVSKLVNSHDGLRPLYVDGTGAIIDLKTYMARQAPTFIPSSPCKPGTIAWYEGGNNIGNVNSSNVIGTCNDVDFLLQAGGRQIINIRSGLMGGGATPNEGFVGIGDNNTSPGAQLDISNPRVSANYTGQREHLRIYGNDYGSIEATNDMNLYFSNSFNINVGNVSSNFAALSIDNSGNLYGSANFYTPAASILSSGKTSLGTQPGAGNGSMLNVNVAGGSSPTNAFEIYDKYSGKVNFRIKSDGTAYCRQVKVTASAFPDYVFESDYKLPSLKEVESYYTANKHLEGVPSAAVVESDGLDVGEINKILVKKVEELTIYMVEQNKKSESQQAQLLELQRQLNALKKDK